MGAVAVGVVVALVVVSQLGSRPSRSAPTVDVAPSILGTVGPGKPLHARAGRWSHAPTSYAYQWQACPATHGPCADLPRATSATYTPPLLDRSQTYRVRVIAWNRIGRTSALSARSSLVLPASPGAPGPAVSCTQTLAVGDDLQTALSNAGPGQVVCLDSGDWGDVTLSRVSPAGNVTLAAAPGRSVHLGSLTIEGQSDSPSPTDNLTIRGFWIDRGVQDLTDTAGGLVFEHNTITRVRQGYGFYFNPDGNGGSHTQSGVEIVSNRISQVGECLAIVGAARSFSFSHNVCGPGIGYGDTASTQPSHYIEVGGIDGLSVTGNAFLGPADPGSDRADLHLNALHLFGGGRHIDFSGNLLWHTQARGQAILVQEGHFDDLKIDDNLDVEDPACGQHSGCANYMAEVAGAHGLSFQNNTVVGAAYGVLLTQSDESGDYRTGSDYVIAHNVVVGATGAPAISYGGCSSSCVYDYNVTDDESAAKAHAAHSVTNWAPAWLSGSRFRAAGIPFAAGYSGILPAG